LETTSAEYLSPFRKSRGRQVWTAEQSGHRKRFINSASRYPSKYLVTNPWPHKRLPKHDGHLSGLGQGYALPRVNISFTTTGKCSIKKPLLGRVIKVGELDNSTVMTLFLSCQINTILSSIYTKHRDKKIPLANSLLRRVTHDYLVDLWHKACQEVGEDIDMYSGLKHSSCSQYVNEKHYSLDQVQMLTDHARRDSVKRYAVLHLEEKRRLLEGK